MATPPTAAILRAVIESPDAIVIFALDREYRYLVFNENHARTMRRIWDVEIEVGASMLDYIAREDDRAKAKANFDRCLAGEAFTIEEEYGDEAFDRRYYEDVYSPIRVDDEVIGLTLFLTDVTEARLVEAELSAHREHLERMVATRTQELAEANAQIHRAQKLESLGLMAGGIAHDFNNLLVGVLGCADLALAQMSIDARERPLLEQIRDAARHASELTDQMLAYAGKRPFSVRPVDLDALVTKLKGIVRASVPRSIDIEYHLESGGVPIPGDPTRLQQVLVNLVTNASEAIGAGRGTITISTGTRDIAEGTPADTFPGDSLAPGRYAVLQVRDDGCGIDDETRARLFDPFFTTKYAGRGLGLASVLGIVRGHNGVLRVESAPGEGATFEVLLPLVSDLPLAPEVEEVEIVPVARGGPRMALVVDDEPIVREISERMLQHLGFSVLSEEDGLAAIRTFEQRRHSITLVFLDMTMPRLGGEATVRRLRDVRPDVPILLASGYASDNERLAFMRDFSNIGFLHKPFDLHQLEQAVEALLAGSE